MKRASNAALRRIGRSKPKFQVGALPYRRTADGSVEVLLVTTRGSGQWIVPKGWPMPGRTWPEAATQEAWEEAGVRGAAAPGEIGRFAHDKSDWLRGAMPCIVAVFPLEVEEELAAWPERGERSRGWFSPDAAAAKVQSRALADIIAAAHKL